MLHLRKALGIAWMVTSFAAVVQAQDDAELKDPNIAAMLFACGYAPEPAPRGPFIKKGSDMELHPEWRWVPEAKRAQVEFSRRRHSGAAFANPLCEAFLMRQIASSGKDAHVKDRCELIRTDLYFAASATGSSSSREGDSDSGLSALDAFFTESRSSTSSVEGVTVESICESASAESEMACAYLRFKENLEGQSAQRAAAKQLRTFCSRKGVNMNELDSSALESMAQSGIFPGGAGGACGPRMGGITIRQQNSWLDTTANLTLGLTKVLAPTLTMWDIARRQQSNARYAIDANRQLGFPSIVTAGQGGFGGGGSCGWGVGGCGGHYAGGYGGGAFIGGGAYTGLGGGCPVGACYGNGGIVVGGGNTIGGGAWGGGTCGVPPMLPGFPGCVGGIGGGGGIGGIGGIGGGPVFGGIGGGGAGWPPGLGVPGFGGGTYFPGAGGGGGGFPGGGFPGPWGTGGGGNGWGGPGSQQGAPAHWGAQNPFNSQMVQAQAQMYSAYAAQMARQAQQSAQAARIYQSTLDDLEKVQSRSYQAWMAYQMANTGLGGFGGSGFAHGGVGAYSQAAGGVASYYPPLMSVPTQRRNSLSIGVSAGFGR
jgi:hypothetical protein